MPLKAMVFSQVLCPFIHPFMKVFVSLSGSLLAVRAMNS